MADKLFNELLEQDLPPKETKTGEYTVSGKVIPDQGGDL
jgi:hypothetical protein